MESLGKIYHISLVMLQLIEFIILLRFQMPNGLHLNRIDIYLKYVIHLFDNDLLNVSK